MSIVPYPDEVEITTRNLERLVADGNGVLVFAYTGVVSGETVQERGPQAGVVLLLLIVLLQPVALVRRATIERGAGATHASFLAARALLQSHWRCISLNRIFD